MKVETMLLLFASRQRALRENQLLTEFRELQETGFWNQSDSSPARMPGCSLVA